jgi:diguanylate cyclase (GGDEF)-like protein
MSEKIMHLLKGLFWVLFLILMMAVGVFIAAQSQMADQLTLLFLDAQSLLPVTLTFEQFLMALAIASLLGAGLVLVGSAAMFTSLVVKQQKRSNEIGEVRKYSSKVKTESRHRFDQFLTISQALTKQLDKRVIVQSMIEIASRMTSVPQASSVVSFWSFQFEKDAYIFDRGFYCDQSLFAKTEFQQNESPFSSIITSQLTRLSTMNEESALIRHDRISKLGSATEVIFVPMVIENAVLGILIIFCHPDAIKDYREQENYYKALWAELTLGLAVAVQGEVAILDRLTGVLNRSYFMRRLNQEVDRANRYQLSITLLMLDIDNFKPVNDMLGHQQGDAVLKIAGKLIHKEVRAIDLVGRYGGEEFVVMLPETGYGSGESTDGVGGPVVAERVRKAIEEEFYGMQKPLNITVSIGVACRRFPEDKDMDIQELIRIADKELYRAKTTGKNKVCVYRPSQIEKVSG